MDSSETHPGPRILYVNPARTTQNSWADQMLESLSAHWADINLEVAALQRGPTHLRYRYYESLVLPDVLSLVRSAECRGFDAVVIGCFFDTGLDAAREVAPGMVVSAPCEAACIVATTLCRKFSIVTGSRKSEARVMENLEKYGMAKRLASLKTLEIGVHEFHTHEEDTLYRLRLLCREAIEKDGAEALILGCTLLSEFWHQLQSDLHVPVIDPVIAAVHWAAYLSSLSHQYGWNTSTVGAYAPPPAEELNAWGLGGEKGPIEDPSAS